MTNEDVVGEITESLPNNQYRVVVDGKEYIAYLGGKMKVNKIRVIVGDRVLVKLDPYKGKATNRITRRL